MVACKTCAGRHKVNATEMAIIIEKMIDGEGHTVGRNIRGGPEIKPICLSMLIPTVARRDAA
jgi:hypothetical protein